MVSLFSYVYSILFLMIWKSSRKHTQKKSFITSKRCEEKKKMITSRHKCLSAWNLYFYACILSFQMMTSHIHKEYLWKHYWILLFTRVFFLLTRANKKKLLGKKSKRKKLCVWNCEQLKNFIDGFRCFCVVEQV